jgi:tRNA-uridine 2-sulfurtransferase
MSKTIAIALSGGIDSLVTAALLKEQGHRPIALHFITGYGAPTDHTLETSESKAAEHLIRLAEQKLAPLARQLRIPLHIIDLRAGFQQHVVDYFVAAYRSGKTPNPCMVCNPRIKFELLLESARNLGAARIATGHYARIRPNLQGGRHLLRGVDALKDQSYFLARLTQDQLAHIVLPLGEFTKTETRRLAAARGLKPAADRESQDVCFIADSDYSAFLSAQPGFVPAPGSIETVAGKVIGRHAGIHRFTIGQRRGLNCPAATPYYVVRIDPDRNCIVVGQKEDLVAPECTVGDINWIVAPPFEASHVMIKLRYRHVAVPAMLIPTDRSSARVLFDAPQTAVTPGQGAVFFNDDEVLGGGWIQ